MIGRRWSWGGMAVLALAMAAPRPAAAQAPGGGPGGGSPGGGGMAAFQKFREQHKYTFQLTRMLRGMNELDKDSATALTQPQAKSVLAVLKPWQTKPKMTQDDAKKVMKGIKAVLTSRQLNALSRVQDRGFGGGGRGGPGGGPGGGGPGGGGFGGPPGGGPGGGGPGGGGFGGPPGGGPGGGGPGGGGGRGGGRRFDPATMKNFNPLLTKADANSPFASRRVERNKRMFAALEARASGKSPAKATAKK
jgi:hypothetical protein